jgi:hypothetical protein
LNPRPLGCEPNALPAELQAPFFRAAVERKKIIKPLSDFVKPNFENSLFSKLLLILKVNAANAAVERLIVLNITKSGCFYMVVLIPKAIMLKTWCFNINDS